MPSEAPSKKRQRDAQRLAEHRERQRVAPILAGWALLARQPLRAVRRIRRDEVWTGWRRETTERKQEARCAMVCLSHAGIQQKGRRGVEDKHWLRPYACRA